MDLATAKILASVALIVGIAIFSYVSFAMFLTQMMQDLRTGWRERAAAIVSRHHDD